MKELGIVLVVLGILGVIAGALVQGYGTYQAELCEPYCGQTHILPDYPSNTRVTTPDTRPGGHALEAMGASLFVGGLLALILGVALVVFDRFSGRTGSPPLV